MFELIPEGTFFADQDLTGEQFRAIELVKKIGAKLANDNPEIAGYYRDEKKMLSQLEIARMVIPEKAALYPEVAEKAVCNALSILISPEERNHLAKIRRQKSASINFDRSHDVQSQRSLIRHKLHGVDVKAMLEARGRTAWTEEEKETAKSLVKDLVWLTTSGFPDFKKIALELNKIFHSQKEIRFENSVRSFINGLNRKKTKIE